MAWTRVVLVVGVAVVLAGCSDDSSPTAEDQSSPTSVSVVESIDQSDASPTSAPPGAEASATDDAPAQPSSTVASTGSTAAGPTSSPPPDEPADGDPLPSPLSVQDIAASLSEPPDLSVDETCSRIVETLDLEDVTLEIGRERAEAFGALSVHLPERLLDETTYGWIMATYLVVEAERLGVTAAELDQSVNAQPIADQAVAEARARHPGTTFDVDDFVDQTERLCDTDLDDNGTIGAPG